MGQKILVVEDAQGLRSAVLRTLAQEGYAASEAADGSKGLALALEKRPDLVLTDADMPGLSGHELCRALKRNESTQEVPVIIMSGEMMEEKDVVAGLEGGADDYLLKPFTMKVLMARIRAVLRRYARDPQAEERLKKRGVELDPGAREVRVAGKPVPLTRKEFDLLALLIEKAGRVLSNGYLLETVWGYDLADYNDDRTVETHVSRLRHKLGPKAAAGIVNVRGLGYKFEK